MAHTVLKYWLVRFSNTILNPPLVNCHTYLSVRLGVVDPDLTVATAQGDTIIVVRPLDVEDTVHQSPVLRNHFGLTDPPALTIPYGAPRLSTQPPARARGPAGGGPGSVRLPPSHGAAVVSLDGRLDPCVDYHQLPELGSEGYEVSVPGLLERKAGNRRRNPPPH